MKEKGVETLAGPVTVIHLEVQRHSRCVQVLYVMTRRLQKRHQYEIRLKLRAKGACYQVQESTLK